MTERADGQVTWSDLGLWSGKTCPEPSAATKGETLRQSSKRSSASQSRKPPILKCLKRAGQLGGATTMKWEDDGAWLGECMMRNTGESPNAAVGSRLSQILEATPQEKYSLSAKACLGILRRAERRGKDLPETLKAVLLMQSEQGGSVMDVSHACDVIRDCDEVSPSLQARMGTGGNQVPITYGIGNGQVNEASIMAEEVSQTLNTMHDAQAVMCEDVNHALRAKAACAYREDAETHPVQNMVVRRLTPLECERLQGYPDGWTDLGEWMDSKGKRHKDADSPRYKALGNSIALPFWDFLAKRISAQYLRPVTMGSLFDGIGGFPLVFERHNGKGTARWASEIEEFPIAVTKLRFGED